MWCQFKLFMGFDAYFSCEIMKTSMVSLYAMIWSSFQSLRLNKTVRSNKDVGWD